jgi:very-short-patch-repair endonuclease
VSKLVIEVDGSQHLGPEKAAADRARDEYLMAHGLRVLRFNNLQILREPDSVMDHVYNAVKDRLNLACVKI